MFTFGHDVETGRPSSRPNWNLFHPSMVIVVVVVILLVAIPIVVPFSVPASPTLEDSSCCILGSVACADSHIPLSPVSIALLWSVE